MSRPRVTGRWIGLGIVAWAWLASADTPGSQGSDPPREALVPQVVSAADDERRPVWCTPLGCRRAPSAVWTWAAGFGAAVGAAALLARRRNPA